MKRQSKTFAVIEEILSRFEFVSRVLTSTLIKHLFFNKICYFLIFAVNVCEYKFKNWIDINRETNELKLQIARSFVDEEAKLSGSRWNLNNNWTLQIMLQLFIVLVKS